MARTIPALFEESFKRYPRNTLMWEKTGSEYRSVTYQETRQPVHLFAAGLISHGIRKGDRIALIAEGRKDWVICELGILCAGAVNVPISVKIDELSELKFRLAHSGCRMVAVSQTQAVKIRKIKNDLPELEKTILFDEMDRIDSDEINFADIMKIGKDFLFSNSSEFDERINSITGNDFANICYTSGTTADPKGIILTHLNYVANVEQSSKLLPIPETYVSLLILPLDHAFAHTVGIYTLMRNGAAMAFVQSGRTPLETLKNIPQNIKEIKPIFLMSVPSLAKSFRKNIEKGIAAKGRFAGLLFRKALLTAYYYNADGWNRGSGKRLLLKPLIKFYDKLFFSKIRANFGGRLEFFIGGGALLDIELQRFFYAIGIPMFQGYGLTEAAPVISANVPARHKLGSSGSIVADLEVKICDSGGTELKRGEKGEIAVKGENVMAGYWKNDKATSESIKKEWLYTGDMGYLDGDGFLYVLGRFKSLLIGSDGEKYSPEGIEEAIVEHSIFIDQMLLYNNQSPYTVALLVPNKEALIRRLETNKINTDSGEWEIQALKLLNGEIAKFRSGGICSDQFPERWIPSAFAVLGEGFTEDNKFLNSTLKMVRGKIVEFYSMRIEYLFTPEGKDPYNSQNRAIIRKWR